MKCETTYVSNLLIYARVTSVSAETQDIFVCLKLKTKFTPQKPELAWPVAQCEKSCRTNIKFCVAAGGPKWDFLTYGINIVIHFNRILGFVNLLQIIGQLVTAFYWHCVNIQKSNYQDDHKTGKVEHFFQIIFLTNFSISSN